MREKAPVCIFQSYTLCKEPPDPKVSLVPQLARQAGDPWGNVTQRCAAPVPGADLRGRGQSGQVDTHPPCGEGFVGATVLGASVTVLIVR